jgi:uncharacterized membrane protein
MSIPRNILLLAAACVPALAGAVAPRYKAVHIDSVYAGVMASYGVGSHGAVALYAESDFTDFFAAVYRHGGPFGGPEGLPDSEGGRAFDVNGAGDVVGVTQQDGVWIDQAVFWPRSGGKIVIPIPRPGNASQAIAINDAGLVVGRLTITDTKSRCFGWTQDGGYFDFGQPAQGSSCEPADINNHGQVTGRTVVAGHDTAFIWKRGSFQLLPLLPATDECRGASINNAGDVVGSCLLSTAPARRYPVLWRNGVAIDLYPFDDLADGVALGIDDAGNIVGSLVSQALSGNAVLFDGQGGATDLHDLVRNGQNLLLETPGGISKNGSISSGFYKLVPLPQ